MADDRLNPAYPVLSPTGFRSFIDCRRLFLLHHLIALPPSDRNRDTTSTGIVVHDVLRLIHTRGSCSDDRLVEDTLDAHSLTPAAREMVLDHRRRCPDDARASAHEIDRYRRGSRPAFIARARFDAIWVRDGWLDVRDYKTGGRPYERVRDDPGARLLAWVAARDAARKGLRLRLSYEQLSPDIDEDPEPFEPDHDDLGAISDELAAFANALRSEREWPGVRDSYLCSHCEYRSVCRDSTNPGETAWIAAAVPAP